MNGPGPTPAACDSTRTGSDPACAGAMRAGRVLGVVSGKGGVGKTNLVANLAVAAAAHGKKVLLLDGDLGLANIDVLLGLVARRSVADVLSEECSFEDALVEGPCGIDLLPAASGRMDLTTATPHALAALLLPLEEARTRYDWILVDAGAGVGPAVISLAASCDRVLLLTTPEPTALADAYATLKVLSREAPGVPVASVVNAVASEREARVTHGHLERLAKRFLDRESPLAGWLPHDPLLAEAVSRQRAVVDLFPLSASATRIDELAGRLLREPPAGPNGPAGHRRNAS